MWRIAADLLSAILLSAAVSLLLSTSSSATVFHRLPWHGELDDGPQVWVVNDDYSQSPVNAVTVIEKVADPLPDATAIDYAQERYRLLELSDSVDESQQNANRNHSTDWVDASENEIDSELPDEVSEVYNEQATETPLLLHFHPNMSRDEIRAIQGQVMAQFMDWTVDPCTDFYEFACGNWDLHNTVPDDAAGFDTFEKLRDQLHLVLRQLLQDPPGQADSKAVIKAKHLYASCMDLDLLEERKEKPLLQLLDDFGGWPILLADWNASHDDHWVDVMARLRLYNNDIFISLWVGPDGKDSDSHIIQLDQGDLGLPSREYYIGSSNSTVLTAYADFMRGAALALGGQENIVDRDVADLIQFETELAKILIPAEERRNFSAMYRKMRVDELDDMSGVIPWNRYLSTVLNKTVNGSQQIVVYATEYFPMLATLIEGSDSRTLTNYLLWRFVRHRLNNLDQRFQALKQDLYSVLYGRKQQPERWKYCVSYVNGNMGMAVGSLFVKNFFSEDSKNDTTRLTAEVQQIFTEMLDGSDWLDADTKQHAKQKLLSMSSKIGYPSYILQNEYLESEYEGIEVEPTAYFENVLRMLRHVVQEEFKRLDRPVDRDQWSTTPAVVNAYYSRTRNQMILPAGILQPPFYHPQFPRALNYGGIGVVIGHEITHGFDDQGRQFDVNGNLQPWWPEEAVFNFQTRTQCIIEQYSNYTVPDVDLPVNGINTQGENIADNGGVRQAFKAYDRWLSSSTEEATLDESMPELNVTARQLFFLNFAQIWCGTLRPEAAISKVRSAVHSPGRFRVIGSLSNLEEFSQVFQCPAGSPMNPTKRCSIW